MTQRHPAPVSSIPHPSNSEDGAPPSADAVFARIATRIERDLEAGALDVGVIPPFGDHSLNDWAIEPEFLRGARAAAVLIGLVPRPEGIKVILTQRTAGLRDHAGQVALPGGKIDPGDATPADAACREAGEEIGLDPSHIAVLGYLGAYLTRTGFRIVPVVARVEPSFTLHLNPAEVVECFEVPLAFLMNPANHRRAEREWLGVTRHFYSIEFDGRTIWGVTAGILRVLYERLYG